MGLLHLPSSSTVAVGAGFAALLAADASSSSSSAVSAFALAPLLKKVLALLLVLNWRSLPFAWHIQVWKTVPELYVRIWRRGEEQAMAVARDPFEVKSVTKGRVTLGDGDYNMHMSNSTYARVSDAARFRFMLELIGPAFGAGVWSPLAATAFTFYREVPLGARYEIETRVLSWDDNCTASRGSRRLPSAAAPTAHCAVSRFSARASSSAARASPSRPRASWPSAGSAAPRATAPTGSVRSGSSARGPRSRASGSSTAGSRRLRGRASGRERCRLSRRGGTRRSGRGTASRASRSAGRRSSSRRSGTATPRSGRTSRRARRSLTRT